MTTEQFFKNWFSSSHFIDVQTSGTTGIPKIIKIEKEKMRNSAKITCDYLGLVRGNIALLCLPVEYISGKMMVVRAIQRELILKVEKPTLKPLENIYEMIDFCAMTPLQVENSLDKIHWIRNLIIGGSELSEALIIRIHKALKNSKENKIFESYGMSETISHIALKQVYPDKEEYFSILEGVKIRQDSRGCLVIFAPRISDKEIITNDLVELKNETKFKFLGRADNVINSGGVKIIPEILEKKVKKYIPYECIFLGLRDNVFGQKLVLVIESKVNEDYKKLIMNLNFEKKYHYPKDIFFVEKIPRTSNNKVNRLKLLKLLSN